MNVRRIFRPLLLNQATSREYVPRRPESSSIPRIIHQTHKSWEALPLNIRDNIAELRSRNAGWEYRFYDDASVEQFIRDAYGLDVLRYFRRINPQYSAARADLFRYLLLYREGGVYLDIKSTVRQPLDEILQPDDRLVLAQWPRTGRFKGAGQHEWDFAGKIQGGEFQQWHIMSSPGHPYLYAVIQAVMRNIDCYIPHMHGSGRNAVLRLTGPVAYTLAMLPLLERNLHRLVAEHDDLSLEYSIYNKDADHKKLFTNHYTNLTAPVVKPSWSRHVLSHLYQVLDRFRRR